MNGDSPIKNWGGSSKDFAIGRAEKISDDSIVALQEKRYGCWKCPVACGGTMKVESGPYALKESEKFRGHKPEYETVGAFGGLALNDNIESITKAGEICNDYGLDTISVGAAVSFAIECYENGLISKDDTGGIELRWGDPQAIVAMTEKLAKREGFGAVLADGVWAASRKIGPQSKPFAVHVHGEELPMHDSRYTPTLATVYILDATPGRHTQASRLLVPPGLDLPKVDKYQASGQADAHRTLIGINHVMQSAGLCLIGYFTYPVSAVDGQLSAVTGWPITMDEVISTGLRINTMRHAFNLREGLNPLQYDIPGRMVGQPPLTEGPLAGVTIDYRTQIAELLDALGWDRTTTIPDTKTLSALDMEFLAEDMALLRSQAAGAQRA